METRWTARLNDADARDYEAFVATAKGGHYAQTLAWSRIVAAKGWTPRFFLARVNGRVVGAALVQRPRIVKLVPSPVAMVERGPVCAIPEDLEPVLDALAQESRRHGIARVTAMPYWAGDDVAPAERAMARARFRDVQMDDGAHARTLRIEVGDKTDAQILEGGDRKKLRYELRNAARAGATVRTSHLRDDMDKLAALDNALNASQRKSPRPVAWFSAVGHHIAEDRRRGALFLCEHEGKTVSAALILRHGAIAVYVAGASIVGGHPFSKMALPLVAAAKWARDQGSMALDLGGIPLETDTDAKRAAIAQFKRDFSTTPIALVREHARWF